MLPAGSYSDALGEDGIRRLKDWVRAGGTLVTLGEASRWASREKVGLLETVTELRGGKPDVEPAADEKKKPAETRSKPFDLEQAIQPEREPPDAVPGALLRVVTGPGALAVGRRATTRSRRWWRASASSRR